MFNDSKIVSTASGYNTRIPKLDFKITDVGYTERTADFKYCYSYDTAANCQTPNNATTQDIHTVAYGSSDDPINYHGSYLYVKKTSSSNGTAKSGKEWEKCDGSNCAKSTYNEDTSYTSEQYCNTTNGNCYCCIKVNWK